MPPDARANSSDDSLVTSTATGAGIEALRRQILATVAGLPQTTPATLRLRTGVTAARKPLEAARAMLAGGPDSLPADEALLAVLLRQAIDALGEVTGAVIGTDIIDRVFSRHCIGK
jgi:tRNA modification GTPase